ncbi:hypothetical protein GHK29_02315 [Sinorhizobium medicae]|uniref:hypothetical protein n=1 Tax=Rhizobiaceae TaxID=82115 RepID=UPI0011AA7FEF|nr:hypothetical protein [Sinorhizobium medicae]MQU73579.1 hypothetical protein [Sinorhizobium medicae]
MTTLKALAILLGMGGMFRITSRALALLVRLVMVLSLAGYSFSAVNAAMHPDASVQVSQLDEHSSHHGDDHVTVSDTGHHGDQHDHSKPGKSKSSCCQDYCGVAAITCPGSLMSHPAVISIREFIDDTDTVGEAPSLHRPPNI